MTLDGSLDLASAGGKATVTGGLGLVSGTTVLLGNAPGSTSGKLTFEGDQALGGSGTVLFGTSSENTLSPAADSTLTIGSGITVRGSSGTIGVLDNANSTVVNQGTIAADDSGSAVGLFSPDHGFSAESWFGKRRPT